jgi:hypothetical protein
MANVNRDKFGTNVPPQENAKIPAKLLISLKPTFQKRRELSNSGGQDTKASFG